MTPTTPNPAITETMVQAGIDALQLTPYHLSHRAMRKVLEAVQECQSKVASRNEPHS